MLWSRGRNTGELSSRTFRQKTNKTINTMKRESDLGWNLYDKVLEKSKINFVRMGNTNTELSIRIKG